jgi:3'(2'), 5'-bisphosphate nucleotidase
MEYEAELEFAVDLVRGASRIVLEHYNRVVNVRWKGRNDPVTDADEASTVFILRMIEEKFPDDAVLIEERDDDGARLTRRRTWIVDPLDGTKEFIDRNGEFSVMAGLVEAGRPVLGAVAVPVGGVVYGGAVGATAFFEKEGAGRVPLPPRKRCALSDARLIVSRSHRSAKIDLAKEKLGITSEMACGSVGLKMIKVISGEADLYVHFGKGAKLWDTCAPEAVARTAGVMFTDLTGREIDYLSPDVRLERGVIVADEQLHAAALSRISDLVAVP